MQMVVTVLHGADIEHIVTIGLLDDSGLILRWSSSTGHRTWVYIRRDVSLSFSSPFPLFDAPFPTQGPSAPNEPLQNSLLNTSANFQKPKKSSKNNSTRGNCFLKFSSLDVPTVAANHWLTYRVLKIWFWPFLPVLFVFRE